MIQNRTGRWFLTVIELIEPLVEEDILGGFFEKNKISKITTDYYLRTYSAGCYFLDEKYEIWTGKGLKVESTTYEETTCLTPHLTLFGGGFFTQPNAIDFEYVMAEADFNDNVTIYTTIIVCLILMVMMLIWARWQDWKDIKRLASIPLPDNDPLDTYVYQLTVFTGNRSQATCRSKIQFILNGDNDESDIRTLPRISYERGAINSFLMTTVK